MPEHLVDAVDRALEGNQHAVKAWHAVRKSVIYDREASLGEAQAFYEAYENACALPKSNISPLIDDMVIDLRGVD
jgi:hypothetical protein